MNKLLTMPSIPLTGAVERPAHQRIRAHSRVLAVLFTFLLWLVAALTGILMLGALFYTGHHIAFGPAGGDIILGDTSHYVLPAGTVWWGDGGLRFRLAGFVAAAVQFVPAVMVLANLRGLFRLYAAGTVFAPENARRFKQIGVWLIAYAVTPFLSVELLILLDCAIDTAWFHSAEIYALVLGCILFVIAQVMEVGQAIEQDRDGFI